MPCRDYEDEMRGNGDAERINDLQNQNDRLARIACKVMQHLEDIEMEDFILLRDKEVREWWAKHKAADLQAAKDKIADLARGLHDIKATASSLEKDIKKKEKELEKARAELAKRNK